MRLVLTTDYSTTSLVSLADAKQQLRISENYDNNNVGVMLDTARQLVESDANRAILNQTYTLYLDEFPDTIYLPMGIIQSVTSIEYIPDGQSDFTTYDAANYVASTGVDDGRIKPVTNWPEVETDIKDAVKVVFVAGYGATKSTKTKWAETAVLLKLTDLYYDRVSEAYKNVIALNKHYSKSWYANENKPFHI